MKLINLKHKATGSITRLPKDVARQIMSEQPNTFSFVSKESTKAFFKRYYQIARNQEALKNVDFTTNQAKRDNFVQQEGGKVIGYQLKNLNPFTYTLPADEKKAEEKKSWIEGIVEKACINPHDQSLKQSILAKVLIFLGLFHKKEEVKEKTETVHLPNYQRWIISYGTVENPRIA